MNKMGTVRGAFFVQSNDTAQMNSSFHPSRDPVIIEWTSLQIGNG